MSTTPLTVRPAAVAGTFYPAQPPVLRSAVRRAFARAERPPTGSPTPRALIVPHAGYVYSGAVAAGAYLRLRRAQPAIDRVVLLGPSHRVPLDGIGVSGAAAFATPLGEVPVDDAARTSVLAFPGVSVNDEAHAHEHSLEVQLPFLQTVLDDFTLLPLVVGRADPEEVAEVIESCWSQSGTVVVVSTDLSHFHRYTDAVRLDARTAAAIVAGRADAIGTADACGAQPLRGLLIAGGRQSFDVERIDLRNSGDTTGDRQRVVGYGAFAVA
jgi:hypothetical protein